MAYHLLNYCSAVWGGANKTYLDSLFLAQKKLLRIMSYQTYNAHTGPIFKELHLLKVNEVLSLQTATFVYKFLNGHMLLKNEFHIISHNINTLL